jgi:hypothetical protein
MCLFMCSLHAIIVKKERVSREIEFLFVCDDEDFRVKNQLDRREFFESSRERERHPKQTNKKRKVSSTKRHSRKKKKKLRVHTTHNKKTIFKDHKHARARSREREREIERAGRDCWNCFLFCA